MRMLWTAMLGFVSMLLLATCARSSVVHEVPAAPAVLRLESLAFDDPDDALMPLVAWLGEAELVLLGENHHADAEGVAATVRLVRFLHERMGFTLLALEADLYGCTKAWEGLRQGDTDAARLCAYRKDSVSQAALLFWRYVARRARSDRPLALAGFDCQPSSDGSREFLLAELATIASTADQALDPAHLKRASDVIRKLSAYTPRADAAEHDADRATLQMLATWLESLTPNAALSKERVTLFKQLGRSLLADEAQEWAFQQSEPLGPGYHRSFNERDRQMAANLLWLRAQNPGKKIVVWAATGHIVRSLRSIPVTPASEAPLFEPMGKHIAQALGRRAVHIATLHHSGNVGMPNEPALELPTAARGFLEHELHERGLGPRALLDLRKPSQNASWLARSWPARWYLTTRAASHVREKPLDVADIILFLDQTRPHVPARQQE